MNHNIRNYTIMGIIAVAGISIFFSYLAMNTNNEPEIFIDESESVRILNISKEECFNDFGGSWNVPNQQCNTTKDSWDLANLGDEIYLVSDSKIRSNYVELGYTIFNSTDPQTEKGFVLNICDDFKITASELYCLEKEKSTKYKTQDFITICHDDNCYGFPLTIYYENEEPYEYKVEVNTNNSGYQIAYFDSKEEITFENLCLQGLDITLNGNCESLMILDEIQKLRKDLEGMN